jgi:hypothetical protein
VVVVGVDGAAGIAYTTTALLEEVFEQPFTVVITV